MAAKVKKSRVADESPAAEPVDAGAFVGQWNRLVSTTNWEKGRIICHWRDALVAAGAPATEHSDEAWSQLVGNVTSQHVGRLRRVYQRFGEVADQFDGLYWSHFQATLDWDDAEMWLEGAILNGWSVSQMRGKRWETVGTPGAPPPEEAAETDTDDDAPWLGDETADEAAESGSREEAAETSGGGATSRAAKENEDDESDGGATRASADYDDAPRPAAKSRSRLGVEVDELPDDLADAFESFKLAIIAQRRLGWSETTPQAVLECLDALRELTLAPADD